MQKNQDFNGFFNSNEQVVLLGLMSGTSLDGLDLALISFDSDDPSIFQLIKNETITYTNEWQTQLKEAHLLSGEDLIELDRAYGRFLGECVTEFLKYETLKPVAVCSHGHTVFHRPDKGFTLQIGHGGALAAASGIPVISDFRSVDIALGGQGAPLVPIGDKLLWKTEAIWVNLGGIANLTIPQFDGKLIAFDICPVNMALNPQAQRLGQDFDNGGLWASKGTINKELLTQLLDFDFFNQKGAKSLGREWYESYWKPLLQNAKVQPKDALATLSEAIALIISEVLNKEGVHIKEIKFTGGGALNNHLMDRIQTLCPKNICTVPERELLEFKEAIIFAFLGYLWLKRQNNVLSEVTGGSLNHIGGCLYWPFQ